RRQGAGAARGGAPARGDRFWQAAAGAIGVAPGFVTSVVKVTLDPALTSGDCTAWLGPPTTGGIWTRRQVVAAPFVPLFSTTRVTSSPPSAGSTAATRPVNGPVPASATRAATASTATNTMMPKAAIP